MCVITDLFINERIRDKEVRLIDSNGEQLGIVSISEARKIAEEKKLDLVKIVPDARPPVCKIINYGKYKYELLKKEKEARKKQKIADIKEIRISVNIGAHDLEVKIKQALGFIKSGNKVKLSIKFRGREIGRMELANDLINKFTESMKPVSLIEKSTTVENRNIFIIFAPAFKN